MHAYTSCIGFIKLYSPMCKQACVENMTVDSLLEEIAIKMSTRSFENIKKIRIKMISSDGFLTKPPAEIMDLYCWFLRNRN